MYNLLTAYEKRTERLRFTPTPFHTDAHIFDTPKELKSSTKSV